MEYTRRVSSRPGVFVRFTHVVRFFPYLLLQSYILKMPSPVIVLHSKVCIQGERCCCTVALRLIGAAVLQNEKASSPRRRHPNDNQSLLVNITLIFLYYYI